MKSRFLLCVLFLCPFMSKAQFSVNQYGNVGIGLDVPYMPDGTWNNEYGYGLVDAYNSLLDTPEIVYIQNDTITGTQTIPASSSIPAEKIYIGKDVTDREEHGNVILGQGDITLRAKSVMIKNSTTVPLGTKLKIVNQ